METFRADATPLASETLTRHTGPMPNANEIQVGGNHYKTGGEEHWDRVDRLGLDYFQGQITKYVERWKLKNGIQDLEKARHFLDKYLELQRASEAGAEGPSKGYVDQDR